MPKNSSKFKINITEDGIPATATPNVANIEQPIGEPAAKGKTKSDNYIKRNETRQKKMTLAILRTKLGV